MATAAPLEFDQVESPDRSREPLLKTKLFAPPRQPNCLSRPHLVQQMNGGLDKVLILIAAPAGYGKTTLVSTWLAETKIPSTWLSLDEDDNDPIRFLQYFIAALQKIVPAVQLDLLGVLQGGQPNPAVALINLIINIISEDAGPFILVLDDFHVIQSQPVMDLMVHLLDHKPPQMHMVFLTRNDPPLPLSRLRVRGLLTEIRADQLRFTREEISQLLNGSLVLNISPDDIIALESRTEGWIAGLQLAAVSIQGGKDPHDFISAFSGSHHYIMDYLAEEVLKLQSESLRSFLLSTSILDHMCGSLCDELFASGQTGLLNGQAMLEILEQRNLFIIPLDSERRWFRYHHLFADVLNRRLEQLAPHQLPILHDRASRWYARNGYIFDAIRHSLLAGDRDRATNLVDQHGCQLLIRGEVVTLLHWIEVIEPGSQTFPWIAIQKAWALCLTGQPDRAEGPLQIAAQLIASQEWSEEAGTMMGAVTAARAYRANMQGDTRLAVELARQALAFLPLSTDFSCSLRSVSTSILGDAGWLEGNIEDARRAYTEALQISQAAGNPHMTMIATSNLVEILLEQGQLQQSARIASAALQLAALPAKQISPLAERLYAALSKISYQWNQLEDAARYIQQSIELSQRWGSIESQAAGLMMSAQLEFVRCNPEKTQIAMRSAERLIGEVSLPTWRSISVMSDLARLCIAQGDLGRACYLVQKAGIRIGGVPEAGVITYLQEPNFLTLLHLYLAQADYDSVLTLSERLLHQFDQSKRLGKVVEIKVLRALAFQGKGNFDQALAHLDQAISIARPEGYIRVFIDEGEPMAKLLYQARVHRVGNGYPAELIRAIGIAFGSPMSSSELLIDPLTHRELELLQLIEAGYSNQEIAAALVISIPTVKRHISNIYAKLGASSRTQAVSRGKELGLFA